MANRKIAIIGSHGLYANYGGWDQLVKNLAELKSNDISYLIFNSADTPNVQNVPPNVTVKKSIFKASGFQGIFYDFWSILYSYWKVDGLLLLGAQGIPLISILSIFKKVKVATNVGGIEWERPKFNYIVKQFWKLFFKLSFKSSDYVILDNAHYKIFAPSKAKAKIEIIPYGGEIDNSLEVNSDFEKEYKFINEKYFLSISRSLEDNMIEELCHCFSKSSKKLVLISNLSNSNYGKKVMDKYQSFENIVLIDGLYVKPKLDLIRRKCKAYIHTHTLCGTAPSLVEMIRAQRPIISFDIPQNRYTLHDQGVYYSDFDELFQLIEKENDFNKYMVSKEVYDLYKWERIVGEYEKLFN